MQKVRIPIMVDPVKAAGKQLSYDGLVPSAALERFRDLLLESCNDVEVTLNFAVDAQGVKYFNGVAAVAVTVACERCQQPMDLAVHAEFAYAPITKRQQADDIPAQYEPIELNELGEVNLHQVVEDELILAMPVVVKHAPEDCQIKADDMQWGEIDETAEAESNPFAVLQELKKK
ncbi:23S rRNA accumulation protein YceD [Pseudidiomarina taiwanensis]|uniref:Large ribosomal RNA subunit accumulation protein YceD n=1 Tax=Pseudidiomarina taiwanensis TaxID=337250 RepID=A0A432ZNG5_9GAMM|nr:23S rRNA accumulation protein YceD [Pseudidiomarina taiwanensis]RUO79416.1 23S rRNA accumulation protein YceD [Pseudidiomarina taiwanensis]